MSMAFERLFFCKACRKPAKLEPLGKGITLVCCPSCGQSEFWNEEIFVNIPLDGFQPMFKKAEC